VTGVFVAGAALVAFSRFYWADPLPITFYLTWILVASAMLAGMRASYRVISEWSHRARRELAGEPVLIYGAGFAGSLAVREILENEELEMRPIGFLDDDPGKLGRMTAGYPVLGALDRLEELVAVQAVRGLIIASGKIGQEQLDEAARLCERSGIWMKVFRVAFDAREAG
jgi:FlaA1/EpsC-like NDP-sugar epimerase